ncbi:hypothetical protein HMPREF0454_01505 [Hafnia alvei ATCC 51873]|uniref:Uncharacterized protein n=1 Tax=Hafnia alvei ATCC 51873 TaxID=1002364 RepID=G9Y4M2_HAFAL|nr:hypothetical protein HMPREF0454_01505 [Hafnia alvei ATCC 51873]
MIFVSLIIFIFLLLVLPVADKKQTLERSKVLNWMLRRLDV